MNKLFDEVGAMNAVVQAICSALVGNANDVDWAAWSLADWDRLAAAGEDQGVLPLLAHTFGVSGWPSAMPSPVRATIEAARYRNAAHTALLHRELDRILAALATVAPVVVLKGAALGREVYPNAGLRPLSDIDLLVPEHTITAVCATLRALGYADTLQPALAGGNENVEHHVCLQGGPAQRVVVEIHWRLIGGAADWRSPDQAWFWQQTQRGTAKNVLHLTPTAHLLYLAAHVMLQHGGAQARLIWLYDLHLLLTRCAINWDLLVTQASTYRWAAALDGALRATQQFFGTPLPAGVLHALATTTDPSSAEFVHRKAVTAPQSLRSTWLDLHALRWSTRAWWIWRAICPSPRYMQWRYRHWPAVRWTWPVCYPYRWGRALGAALRCLVRPNTHTTIGGKPSR